ncbi:MgtC/SapB family protein [Novosphingobium sp. ZN18A2]|uniref:MgtC/SapB family protein n=1 Tax=Novosphingobium sp. ZN18A2 TaxID=3079861 RepID=UPI0030CD36AC
MNQISPLHAETLTALAAAVAAGLIVGVERGWALRDRPTGGRVSGVRTFGLIGLTGGIAGLAPDIFAAIIATGVVALVTLGYFRTANRDHVSATSAVAAVLTFAIGFTAVRVAPIVALSAAAASFALLSARRYLHTLLNGLTEQEIEGVARFLVVALVVLPLLPDTQMGPFDAWNPRRIWMVVVLVAALSFAGYVAARRWGQERGILVVAITGAIVSSTAVTAEYARRMRDEPQARSALAAGISIASIVMFVRVQLLTAILVPSALPTLALTMAPATIVAGGFALVAWMRQRHAEAAPVKLGNPFDFAPALILAGSVVVLSVAARWALARFGDEGIAVVLGLTGLMDVDAAVLTLAGLPGHMLSPSSAGVVLAVPVLANTAIKAALSAGIAFGRGGVGAAMPLVAALGASALAMLLWTWAG